MYNLSNQVLEQYPFEVEEVIKGRGAYICRTDMGKVILREFPGSAERAAALEAVLLRLEAAGVGADRMVHTTEGELLAKDGEETAYYARYYIEGRECDPKNRDDILRAMQEMAVMHRALQQSCVSDVGEQDNGTQSGQEQNGCTLARRVPGEAFCQEVKKHNRELRKVRNYIHGKHKKNAFEMMFMQHFEGFMQQALHVEQRLETWLQEVDEETLAGMYGVCHGDYNQHNVVFAGKRVMLTNWEQACCDMQIVDVAHFLRKLMEKHNFNIGLGSDMMSAYEKNRKLTPDEWEQLYLRMAYPEKFWKVANHYFNSNKAWVSGRDIEKLRKVLEQEEKRQEFLRMLFYFV